MFKHILITGSSSGLGEALAKELAPKTEKMTLTGRNIEKLRQIEGKLPCKVATVIADLARTDDKEKIFNLIDKDPPDLLINNAGAGLYGEILSHSIEAEKEIFQLNAETLFDLTLKTVWAFKKNKIPGTILNISSAASFFTFPYLSVYAATKAFVTSFSLSLDEELKKYGIRILVACPGKISTAFGKRASLGKGTTRKDFFTMSAEKAARLIARQIKEKKTPYILDFKYRLLILFSKILPRKITSTYLMSTIKKRIS